MNVLLAPPRSGIVRAGRIEAQVQVGVSAELAVHHLGRHPCPDPGGWDVDHYECGGCAPGGPKAMVVSCPVCGEPLAVTADVICDHFAELLDGLKEIADAAVAARMVVAR